MIHFFILFIERLAMSVQASEAPGLLKERKHQLFDFVIKLTSSYNKRGD